MLLCHEAKKWHKQCCVRLKCLKLGHDMQLEIFPKESWLTYIALTQ